MMKAPTTRATIPKISRAMPRKSKIRRNTSWLSAVKALPVMAWVFGGRACWIRDASCSWVTPSWPATLIQVSLPGSTMSSWARAVVNSAADDPA